MDKKQIKKILKQTKTNYNRISGDFSSKREYLSDDILYFKKFIKPNFKILDIGCGNGRLAKIIKNSNYIGIDNSEKLLKIAKNKFPKHKFIFSDALNLPKNLKKFNIIFSLSVLHHIPGEKNQQKFINNIYNHLEKNGITIISIWKPNKKQLLKSKQINNSNKNIYIPFQSSNRKIKVDRYIYLFDINELEELFKKNHFKILESGYLTRGKSKNIYIVGRKI